jgi:hypothetical protein
MGSAGTYVQNHQDHTEKADKAGPHTEFVQGVDKKPSNPRMTTNPARDDGTANFEDKLVRRRTSHSYVTENPDAKLNNHWADYNHDDIVEMGREFAKDHGMLDMADEVGTDAAPDGKEGLELWAKAALVARNPLGFEGMRALDEADREALRKEQEHSERIGCREVATQC